MKLEQRPGGISGALRVAVVLVSAVMLLSPIAQAAPTLMAVRSSGAVTVDGLANESAWRRATAVTVKDGASAIPITLKALHDGKWLYLLARFPDPDESREHKTLLWNPELKLYDMGPDREDTLVIKWAMTALPTDLTLTGGIEYRADIWYWKAHRTDPTGFADDKIHIYSAHRAPRSFSVTATNGRLFYITRSPDLGESAYRTLLEAEFRGERLPAYSHQMPVGSRGDVHAKGVWSDGEWVVEFSRLLDTGHGDDVVIDLAQRHRLAVSRYEIAGRTVNPAQSQPLHGAGEVSEVIELEFEP